MAPRTIAVAAAVALLLLAVAPAAQAQSSYCTTCMDLVKNLQNDGTDKVCDLIGATQPPESTVCDWIVDHLADFILKELDKGFNATNICRTIGMCSSRGCPCGECQSAQFNSRCLRFPNDCPSTNPLLAMERSAASTAGISDESLEKMRNTLSSASSKAAAALRGFLDTVKSERLQQAARAAGNNVGFCLDGTCDSSKVGCCLACL